LLKVVLQISEKIVFITLNFLLLIILDYGLINVRIASGPLKLAASAPLRFLPSGVCSCSTKIFTF